MAGEGVQLTAQQQPLNGLDCSLLIAMGISYEVNYMLFLNLEILENLGYLSRFSSSYCFFSYFQLRLLFVIYHKGDISLCRDHAVYLTSSKVWNQCL